MTIDHAKQGARHHDSGRVATQAEGSSTRRRILQIALTLMAQRGVDGTSMRDLASAAGLNVASLYHYFPSKRDLLEAVLVEQGFLPIQAPRPDGDGDGDGRHNGLGRGDGRGEVRGEVRGKVRGEVRGDGRQPDTSSLEQLLADILVSMFEVQDFVRLMVGESMRDESTARAVGLDLFGSFHTIIEDWVRAHRPDLDERSGAAAVARLLSAMVVGIFVEHAAGVLSDDGADPTALCLQRAREAAQIVGPPRSGGLGLDPLG